MAAGMLPGLFSPQYKDLRAEQQDEDARLRGLATMDPFQAAAYASYSGASQAGKGLGGAVASAAGLDTRSPARLQMDQIQAAKAEVQQLGFDPQDPKSLDKFYLNVIKILQSKGLAAEAAEMAKEWRTYSHETAKDALGIAESQRKAERDKNQNAAAIARNAILAQRLGTQGPEVIQLLGQLDAMNASDALKDPYKEKAIMARIDELTAPKGIKVVPAGDHYDILGPDGKKIGTDEIGAKPLSEKDALKNDAKEASLESAYKEAKASWQQQYDSAVDLYNHPGVGGITGRFGRLVGEQNATGSTTLGNIATTAAGSDSRGALALWKQVTGSTFLAGLARLKSQSPTGSTGLGAVSNIEGEKVQAAAAALSREQDAPEFRQRLATYIQILVDTAKRVDEAAAQQDIPAIPLRPKPLTGAPTGRRPAASPRTAAPAPSVAPAAPSAAPAGGSEVWGRDPSGKIVRKVGG